MTVAQYLWVEDVLHKTVIPYGTFEKAKYLLVRNGNEVPLYFFTTTCRNTEECISIMERKFELMDIPTPYFKVYKVMNGIKQMVYTNKPVDKL